MADIDSLEKRLNSDRKKARSDKKMAEVVVTYEKTLEQLNAGVLVTNM